MFAMAFFFMPAFFAHMCIFLQPLIKNVQNLLFYIKKPVYSP